MTAPNVVEVTQLKTVLGGRTIHHDLTLTVKRGEILILLGGTGSGKTTLLREILGLQKFTAGSISVLQQPLNTLSPGKLVTLQKRLGVCFQQNALFGGLTVLDNVAFPLRQHTNLAQDVIIELAMLKILLAGLPEDAALKYPAELSGGMQKRAALARALALDPELLFLDEPTAGLDPDSADGFDRLILSLQRAMDLTIVMVTHDLHSVCEISDRVAFLGEGRVLEIGNIAAILKNSHPLIKEFFGGPRGVAMQAMLTASDENSHGK